MTWDPTQPVATQSPALFPSKCQDNWEVLEANIDEDHNFVEVLPGTNPGYHKIVHWVNQGSTDPMAITGVAQSYTKNVTVKRDSSNVTTEHLFAMPGSNNATNITNPLSVVTIKAAVRFETNSTANSPQTIISAYNVTSVDTVNSHKYDYKVTLDFSFPGTGYLVLAICTDSGSTQLSMSELDARDVDNFTLRSSSTQQIPVYVDVIVLGI